MASLKFYAVCAIVMLVFNNIAAAVKYQQNEDEALGEERARDLDSLGGGHLLRGLDSIGEGNLLRAIYRDKPRSFMRINRGLDSLSGASFGIAKRLDSLAGMGFGTQKRNLDEIDRSNFGTFSKRNLDEIDRSDTSDFDRFVKKREAESEEKILN